MLKQQRLILLTLSLVLISSLSVIAAPEKLTIMHVNDTHGFLFPFEYEGEIRGGMPQILALVKGIRAENPNSLFLSAGDMLTGSNESYRLQWKQTLSGFRGTLILQVMNQMEFDAMVLGNHEFDYGKRWLTRLLSIPEFPVLSANIVHDDLPEVGDRNGTLFVAPYEIFEFSGLRVAIVGLTTSAYMQSTLVKVVEHTQILSEMLPELKEQSDLIVILSHLGMSADRALANALPGEIDVIIGGHSHTATTQPVFAGSTLIVQTGDWGRNLGILDLHLEGKTIVSNDFKLIPIFEDMLADEQLQMFIEQNIIFGEIIGGPLFGSNEVQSPLSTLITDAMRWFTGADFALVQSGVAKGTIPEGIITPEAFFEVFWPHRARIMGPEKDLDEEQLMVLVNNALGSPLWTSASSFSKLETIVVLKLTSAEMAELLVKSETWRGKGNFLQVSSNLPTQEELNEDSDRVYQVAVNLNLALGDGGYGLFEKRDSFEFMNLEVFEAVMQYLKSKGTLHRESL